MSKYYDINKLKYSSDTINNIDFDELDGSNDSTSYAKGGNINYNTMAINKKNKEKKYIMEDAKFNQFPHIVSLNLGDNIVICEDVFNGDIDKPKHIGFRYIYCQVVGNGGMINSLNLKVLNSKGVNNIQVGSIITRPIYNVMYRGRKLPDSLKENSKKIFKDGGINADNKEVKDYFAHDSGSVGGVLVGKRHSEGGIKAINKSTGKPIEMEGGEVVITRGAVSNPKKYNFNGKELTTRDILSKLNVDGGGISFEGGGDIPQKLNFNINKMNLEDTNMTPQEFVNLSENDYQKSRLSKGVEKERKDHYITLVKLSANIITTEEALIEIALREMIIDSKYPFGE